MKPFNDKAWKGITALLTALMVLLTGCTASERTVSSTAEESTDSITEESSAEPQMKEDYIPMNYTYMKAVWLSQFDLQSLYQENGAQRDQNDFTSLLKTVLEHLKNDGYNTVIVQVRPYADSFYPSEYYPVSSYISGKYGNEEIYDPFAIILREAHARGFSVHAWINPMRAMKTEEFAEVPERYLIRQWFDDEEKNGNYLSEVGGRYYLNPAHEEVRLLIAAGVRELAETYEIDGIHIDDYFYPTTDPSFDAVSYSLYKENGGTLLLNQFRYSNIDSMVSGIYNAVKSVDERILFGVSPLGNLNTTYTTLYTDVYKWCSEEGYLDYICPQIYFGLEHQTHDFKTVYNTWADIVTNKNVRLVVGMTLGKAQSGTDVYAGTGQAEWREHKDVLKRCLEFLAEEPLCSGVSVFCYQFMYDPLTGESVAETAIERANMKGILTALGE